MQSFETSNSLDLSPLIKEKIKRQQTMNIWTMGYFSHSKSAIVNGITGNQTSLHKIEIKRNII